MRIIDKYKDYYDYIQNVYRDDTLVFDRRKSDYLTDDYFIGCLYHENFWNTQYPKQERFCLFLLRIGYTNWIIKANPIFEVANGEITDYSVEVFHYWKDYDYRTLTWLSKINFDFHVQLQIRNRKISTNLIENLVKNKQFEFRNNDVIDYSNECSLFGKTKLPSIINPESIYRAYEEYFSSLKNDIVTDNMTDVEKIISHGFDKRESFRKLN